jgi:hypothetical protein
MTINQHFLDFLAKLTPSTAEVGDYATHRNETQAKLEQYFNSDYVYETGSFKNGSGIRYYSDLDLLVSIPTASQRENSYNMLLAVKSGLQDRFPTSSIHISTPAVRITFSDNRSVEVTPGYFQQQNTDGYNEYLIPDYGGGWQKAAPSAHIRYVTSINTSLSSKVKPLIRLIKAIKYYQDIPISSFYLELRTTKYCEGEEFINYEYDVCRVLNRLVADGLADMRDPAGISGLVSPCSTDNYKEVALSRLTTARDRARKAIDAEKVGNHTDALYWWKMVFGREI